MRFAIVIDGQVVNTAVGAQPVDSTWVASETAAIGDLYDGTEFTRPLVRELIKISKTQALAALDQAGLLAQLDTYMEDVAPPMTRRLWEAAPELWSDSPMLLDAWADMGRSESELYSVFLAARDIRV